MFVKPQRDQYEIIQSTLYFISISILVSFIFLAYRLINLKEEMNISFKKLDIQNQKIQQEIAGSSSFILQYINAISNPLKDEKLKELIEKDNLTNNEKQDLKNNFISAIEYIKKEPNDQKALLLTKQLRKKSEDNLEWNKTNTESLRENLNFINSELERRILIKESNQMGWRNLFRKKCRSLGIHIYNLAGKDINEQQKEPSII